MTSPSCSPFKAISSNVFGVILQFLDSPYSRPDHGNRVTEVCKSFRIMGKSFYLLRLKGDMAVNCAKKMDEVILREIFAKDSPLQLKYSQKIEIAKIASRKGHLEVFNLILSGENSCVVLSHFLNLASTKGWIKIVEILLNQISSQKFSESVKKRLIVKALEEAIRSGHAQIVKTLLNSELLPADAYLSGVPFYLAEVHQHYEVLKILLKDKRIHLEDSTEEKGLRPQRVPIRTSTAIECVERHRLICKYLHSFELATLLLNHPYYKTIDWNVILVKACEGGHTQLVRFLLASEKINLAYGNYLAYKIAVNANHRDIVRLFSEYETLDFPMPPYQATTVLGFKTFKQHAAYLAEVQSRMQLPPDKFKKFKEGAEKARKESNRLKIMGYCPLIFNPAGIKRVRRARKTAPQRNFDKRGTLCRGLIEMTGLALPVLFIPDLIQTSKDSKKKIAKPLFDLNS